MRTLITALLTLTAAATGFAQELGKPVRLEAAGGPIDTEIGHAYPYVYDFDKDGQRDLLVGQFGGGKLKIFRNLGTNAAPRFGEAAWLEADGKVVTTPAG